MSPNGDWLVDSLGSLIYHESTAAFSMTYEPLLIPGLLQTADYARAQIAAERWRNLESIERCVNVRMRRQQILNVPHPARFSFFVHERVLRQTVGSAAVMQEQMLKLVLMAALDHVTVRVVEHSAFGGAFRLFEYPEYPPLVYLDTYTTGLFLEDQEYVAPFRELLPVIAEVALDEGQSRALIATLASEYDLGSERDAADRLEEEQF